MATIEEVSISSWLSRHEHRTFRTRLIPLPPSFIDYLKCDGSMVLARTKDNDDAACEWHFPELEDEIDAAISRLGGEVFVKLNWSAPRDASWILGSLKCRRASDVYSLLKASDFAAHDVELGANVLALREWREIDPSLEFRCFVQQGRLVAACQRKTDSNVEHGFEEVKRILANFYDTAVRPDHFESVAFDVFLDPQKTFLVDLNLAAHPTDPLFFTWDQLREMTSENATSPVGPTDPNLVEMRLAKGKVGSHIASDELANFRAPSDILQLADLGGITGLMAKVKAENHNNEGGDTSPSVSDGEDDAENEES